MADDRQELEDLRRLDELQSRAAATSVEPSPFSLSNIGTQIKSMTPDLVGVEGSALTGLLRGVGGLGNLANPLPNLVNRASNALGGPTVLPTPENAIRGMEPYLHQPQGTMENIISAGASALPYSVGGSLPAAAMNVLGAGAGEAATRAPILSGMPPELSRLVGTLGLPLAGQVLRYTPTLLGGILGLKEVGKAITENFKNEPATAANTPSAERLYELSKTGQYPQSQLDAMAKINREKLWGPDDPAVHKTTAEMIATGLLKLGQRFGLNPLMQSQINSDPSTPLPTGVVPGN